MRPLDDLYVQRKSDNEPTYMWGRMADVMLAKCAEALALRRRFPQDLSGLYSPEEMQQAEDAPTVPVYVQSRRCRP